MICPKCENSASYYKEQKGWFCHACNEWLEFGGPGMQQAAVPVTFSKWETTGTAALCGFVLASIGLVISIVYWEVLWYWPMFGSVLMFLICGMPLFGGILVLTGHLKAGGYFLMVGGAVMIPIGLIGIYGGQTALKIAKHSGKR